MSVNNFYLPTSKVHPPHAPHDRHDPHDAASLSIFEWFTTFEGWRGVDTVSGVFLGYLAEWFCGALKSVGGPNTTTLSPPSLTPFLVTLFNGYTQKKSILTKILIKFVA